MKPLIRLSNNQHMAFKVGGEWWTPQDLVLDANETPPEGCTISGGKVTISGVYRKCTFAKAQEVMSVSASRRPALTIDGHVWIEDAIKNAVGSLSSDGGWLESRIQSVTIRERESFTQIVWDDNDVEHRVDTWSDTGKNVAFTFRTLGIVGTGNHSPYIRVAGARWQSVARTVAKCKKEGLFNRQQTEIIDGGHKVAYDLELPPWDLQIGIDASYGEGPFYRPRHEAAWATNLPFNRSGGGGGGSWGTHWDWHQRYDYFYHADLNWMSNSSDILYGAIHVNRYD